MQKRAFMHREARPCPTCGTTADQCRVLCEERFDESRLGHLSFASRKLPELMHWRLLECPVCALAFASPAPTADFITAAYRNAAYDSHEEARHAGATYGELVAALLPRLPAEGGALDVGAGDGAFLAVLRAVGFDAVTGVEPSKAALEDADPEIRPLIREDVFSGEDFEPQRYRLVTCLQAVEHLPDPLCAFKDARRLLRDGGALLVVCHDRCAIVNRALGRRSPIYDVEHLQLLCSRSLRELLARAGFEEIELRHIRNRYPLRYWVRLAPLGRRTKPLLVAALDRVGLGSMPLSLPVGNLAAVAWRR